MSATLSVSSSARKNCDSRCHVVHKTGCEWSNEHVEERFMKTVIRGLLFCPLSSRCVARFSHAALQMQMQTQCFAVAETDVKQRHVPPIPQCLCLQIVSYWYRTRKRDGLRKSFENFSLGFQQRQGAMLLSDQGCFSNLIVWLVQSSIRLVPPSQSRPLSANS